MTTLREKIIAVCFDHFTDVIESMEVTPESVQDVNVEIRKVNEVVSTINEQWPWQPAQAPVPSR